MERWRICKRILDNGRTSRDRTESLLGFGLYGDVCAHGEFVKLYNGFE